MEFPASEFAACRELTPADNGRVIDSWVVSFDPGSLDSGRLCLLKGRRAHLVMLQNGGISTAPSGRFRSGFWEGGVQHFASAEMLVDGISSDTLFRKYVRRLHCIYRDFGSVERIDFMQHDAPGLCISLKSDGTHDVTFRFEPSHMLMWPDGKRASGYALERTPEGAAVSSGIARTLYIHRPASAEISMEGGRLSVTFRKVSEAMLMICPGGCGEKDFNFEEVVRHHSAVAGKCTLHTPDFTFDKAFLWAKHDLLEFYSETEVGNGFFAGFPEFSWFFGRDGEWMSMAAAECGLSELASEHLKMLERHSENGRVPHEIPIVTDGRRGTYTVGEHELHTRFMSIDSTPLWVMCQLLISRWTGAEPPIQSVRRAIDFCKTCDIDGDGLIENRLSKGLIGWPESWADRRDGACIEVNAWWREALRQYCDLTGAESELLVRCGESFERTFFTGSDGGVSVADSRLDGTTRYIRNAMLVVPAMYGKGGNYVKAMEMMSGGDSVVAWGLRSVSASDPTYDRGYHTGQVWPLMTGWFVLAAYNNGMAGEAFRMLSSFPRLAFGSADPGRINEVYHPEYVHPMGQFAQGWSSSLFIQCVIEGLFGLNPDGREGRDGLSGCTPRLPAGWDAMELRNVEYHGEHFDIRVGTDGFRVSESR